MMFGWRGSRRVLYTPCNRDVFYICLTMPARDKEAAAVPVRKEVWRRSFPHLEPIIARFGEEGRYDRFVTTHLKRWGKGRVAVLGDAAQQRDAIAAFEAATGFLQRELAQRLQLKRAPELKIELDGSIAEGDRVLALLDSLKDADALDAKEAPEHG